MRQAMHVSIEQLAARCAREPFRLSPSGISSIERGRNLPSLQALLFYQAALFVEPEEVLERLRLSAGSSVDLTGTSVEQLESRGNRAFWAGEFRDALRCYDAALERLILDSPTDPAERKRWEATIELRRAATLRRLEAPKAARAAAERAIAWGGGHPEIQSGAYQVLASVLCQLGNLPLARDAAERAVGIAGTCAGDIQGHALVAKGLVLLEAGQFEEARLVFLEARQKVLQANDDPNQIHIEGNIGLCWMGLGRAAEARTWVTRAMEMARQRKVPAREAFWRVRLGEIAFRDGNLGEATRHAEIALEMSHVREYWMTVFSAEWLLHRIAKAQSPNDADDKRVGRLRKLLARLRDHRGERDVQEFRAEVVGEPTGENGDQP